MESWFKFKTFGLIVLKCIISTMMNVTFTSTTIAKKMLQNILFSYFYTLLTKYAHWIRIRHGDSRVYIMSTWPTNASCLANCRAEEFSIFNLTYFFNNHLITGTDACASSLIGCYISVGQFCC